MFQGNVTVYVTKAVKPAAGNRKNAGFSFDSGTDLFQKNL
ncbi:hypothetical protein SMB34_00440 [Thalassospira permensis NBRC 106175]|jgi:hypothetical protein|uniref:Uncharacterized protein n=1 Tax=Thalassospira permensis NBRC 106175 TaxID=1353532 RepID=A0ABR4TTP1_9PROT|nr:hypothetical protein SMB34_00440 [Thalassospira permensis NBRC 106175]